MASLSVSISSTGNTTAELYGTFTGGQSSYAYQRYIRVTINGFGSFDVYSIETSGGENTFAVLDDRGNVVPYSITGLSPGTTYTWSATLYYRVTGGWDASTYSDSGSFVTNGGGGGSISNAYIYLGSWRNAVPYVYLGSWRPASGKIYLNGWR